MCVSLFLSRCRRRGDVSLSRTDTTNRMTWTHSHTQIHTWRRSLKRSTPRTHQRWVCFVCVCFHVISSFSICLFWNPYMFCFDPSSVSFPVRGLKKNVFSKLKPSRKSVRRIYFFFLLQFLPASCLPSFSSFSLHSPFCRYSNPSFRSLALHIPYFLFLFLLSFPHVLPFSFFAFPFSLPLILFSLTPSWLRCVMIGVSCSTVSLSS